MIVITPDFNSSDFIYSSYYSQDPRGRGGEGRTNISAASMLKSVPLSITVNVKILKLFLAIILRLVHVLCAGTTGRCLVAVQNTTREMILGLRRRKVMSSEDFATKST